MDKIVHKLEDKHLPEEFVREVEHMFPNAVLDVDKYFPTQEKKEFGNKRRIKK